MLEPKDGKEMDEYGELCTILSREGRAMVKCRNVKLTVQVTCICAPDSERRISRAINLLLATAQPNEDSAGNTDENKDQGKASAGSEHKGDSTDAG